jgi:type IV secretory pathway VirB10-like protein
MEDRPDNEKDTGRVAETPSPVQPDNAPEEVEEEPRPKGVRATFREAFNRAQQAAKRGSKRQSPNNPAMSDRGVRNRDRTKTLFVCVAGLVAVLVIFLGIFSSSQTATRHQVSAKRNPSLGRPEDDGHRAGSVTPLLNAETTGQDSGSAQLTPEDINNTSRPRAAEEVQLAGTKSARAGAAKMARRGAIPDAAQGLNDIPFTDPALEAYRQRMRVASADPSLTPLPQPAAPANPESNTLAKASLVYVRANADAVSQGNSAQLLPVASTAEPAFLGANLWNGLPAGTRLVARLQTAVSTAVKAPVVAVIETHYERDGEIILPAGSKAFGELESGSRTGYVGIRFHSLQMPDGTTVKIEASGMGLDFSPLKGQVTGRNRGKQFLARAITGVGSVAAFAVGHPGGLNGAMDNSVLLRDRISQNIGMAGEQEVLNLAYAQEIVVTVPGNTRFFIVLQQGAGQEGAKPALRPAGNRSRPNVNVAAARDSGLPTAAELRELIALKKELDSIRADGASARGTAAFATTDR